MNREAIIFDLDGTLVDSAPDLCAALNAVMDQQNRPRVTLEAVRHMVGEGARRLIEQGLSASGPTPDAAEIERHYPAFIDHYQANISANTTLFPAVRDVLEHLSENGATLALCTNKPIGMTERLLVDLSIDHHFAAVLGGDSLPVRKPDPVHLLETVARIGARSDRAVLVGDSPADIAAARNAAIPVIAVSYGYSRIAPAELGADILIDHFSELPAALKRLD